MKIILILWMGLMPGLVLAQPQVGKAAYESQCAACHRDKGEGTVKLESRLGEQKSVLESRTDLSGPYVRAVVRSGFGTMRSIPQDKLSDAEMAQIVTYLTTARAEQ